MIKIEVKKIQPIIEYLIILRPFTAAVSSEERTPLRAIKMPIVAARRIIKARTPKRRLKITTEVLPNIYIHSNSVSFIYPIAATIVLIITAKHNATIDQPSVDTEILERM